LIHPPSGDCDSVNATDGINSLSLKITEELSIRYDRRPEVVVVNDSLVAKIFDPVFYPACYNLVDTYDFTKEADGDYSREAAAYEELDPMFGGNQIPKYHGF
jgi:hypothetical protein